MKKIILNSVFFIFLTILTQVGGLIYLLCLPLLRYFNRGKKKRFSKVLTSITLFSLVYLFISFSLLPLVASLFGRVALPVFGSESLKPLTAMTWICNRHYVDSKLKAAVLDVAHQLHEENPEVVVSYLDACFPFLDGFPLIPHLSHNDGQKLDLAFIYHHEESGKIQQNSAPSPIGYGVFVNPESGEANTAKTCADRGFWQYGMLGNIIPNLNSELVVDDLWTSRMIHALSSQEQIKKIFIEPHLKNRWKLTSNKVRFHGCHAVRHDDHVHIQL